MEGARLEKWLPVCIRLMLAELCIREGNKKLNVAPHYLVPCLLEITPGHSPGASSPVLWVERGEGVSVNRYDDIIIGALCLV